MSHSVLLDDLETRLRHGDFRDMIGNPLDLVIRRAEDGSIALSAQSIAPGLLISAGALVSNDAPDDRPRIALNSSLGGPVYADHSVDGVVMNIFSIFLSQRKVEG